MQPAFGEVHSQVDQIVDLARRQAGGAHVVDLQAQQLLGRHAGRQRGHAAPQHLRGLDGNLLADDGTR
ncbi:hypothetical protein D3C86_1659860 [compost metagenome]